VKLLVTGGAGFIGSNYVNRLVARDHGFTDITVLDSLTYAGAFENIANSNNGNNVQLVKGDIRNRETVLSVLDDVSAIINFAAESHVDRSIESSRDFMETNILGTQNLLECARERGVEKFIQISTDEVYGSVEFGESEESSLLLPNSPYSASKASADLVCRSYVNTFGMDIRITRCVNNFGPYQHPEKFLPLMITNLLQGKVVPIYGDGLNVREWIHVDDHCEAIDRVLLEGNPGEIYNVGTGNRLSNVELAKHVLDIMGLPESRLEFVRDRPGHDLRYALNSQKIRTNLGYSPKISILDGITDLVSWYSANQSWWKGKLQSE